MDMSESIRIHSERVQKIGRVKKGIDYHYIPIIGGRCYEKKRNVIRMIE